MKLVCHCILDLQIDGDNFSTDDDDFEDDAYEVYEDQDEDEEEEDKVAQNSDGILLRPQLCIPLPAFHRQFSVCSL